MSRNHKTTAERRINHVKTFLSKPANVMLLIFGAALTLLTLIPLLSILREMFIVHVGIEKTMTGLKTGEFTLWHWKKLFGGGDWSRTTFWEPLRNSFMVGFGGAVLGIGVGGTVAWLLARSNLKCKNIITSLCMFPYIMPAWTLALFWLNLFQNSQLGGGNVGIVEALFGICMPKWFVYGLFPTIIVTGLHFAPFAYILIGGILQNMDATLEESAMILKASRGKILWKITLPIVMPAVLSTFLLVFSSGFASYTAPVFLGGAVKFYTLASKMKSLLNAGYSGQAYIIAAVIIAAGIFILWINQKYTGKRKSFTTVTGKSGQISLVDLKKANTPITAVLLVVVIFFSIVPLIVFGLQTITMVPGDYSMDNITLDFWIGKDLNAYMNGMVGGVLVNKSIMSALGRLMLLSVCCALFTGTSGLLLGYSIVKRRGSKLARFSESLAFFPYLIPTIAFATMYLSAASTKTFSFLYNSFLLLVIVGGVKYLPMASRGSINSMLQISAEIEEAAVIVGVPWWKRLTRILIPIQKTSIMSGYLLPFVSCMREVDLFVLLVINDNFLLTTMLLSFNQTGYEQYASAITLLIILIVLAVNALSSKLTGASIAKGVDSGAPIGGR